MFSHIQMDELIIAFFVLNYSRKRVQRVQEIEVCNPFKIQVLLFIINWNPAFAFPKMMRILARFIGQFNFFNK